MTKLVVKWVAEWCGDVMPGLVKLFIIREKLAKAAITQSSSASLKNLSAYNIDNTIRRHHGRISEELEIAETKEGNNI